jgi:hypothetical protein
MLTATGRYIAVSITEQGHFAASNLTELGEYAPTVIDNTIMSGGAVVGGSFGLPYYLNSLCGIVADSNSTFETGYSLATSNGAVAAGPFNIATGYNVESTLGMIVGGQMLPFIIGSLGMVAGGNNLYNWSSAWSLSGGMVTGGSSIKKQFPMVQAAPPQPDFTLTDNSITFKLEVSP